MLNFTYKIFLKKYIKKMYLSCYWCITSTKYIHYHRYLSSLPPTIHCKSFTFSLSGLNFTLTSSTRFVAAILSVNLSANSPLQLCCYNLGEFKLCALEQIHPFMVQTYPIGCIFSFIFYQKPIRHTIIGRESQYIYIYIYRIIPIQVRQIYPKK